MKNFKLAVGLIMVVCVAALFSGCLGDKGDVTTPVNTDKPATTTGIGSAGQSENSADQIAALTKKIDELNNQIQSLQSSQQAGQQTSGYDDTQLKSQITDLQSQLNDAQTNLQAAKDAATAARASADSALAAMQKKKVSLTNYKVTNVQDSGGKSLLGKLIALDCRMSCGAGKAIVGFNATTNDYPIITGIQFVCANINDTSDRTVLKPLCGLNNDNGNLNWGVSVPAESFATGFSFNVGDQLDNFTLVSDNTNFNSDPPSMFGHLFTNPIVGGKNDTPYKFSCGTNQVLTGVTFNSREVVNGIRNYTCADIVRDDGSAAQTPPEPPSNNRLPSVFITEGQDAPLAKVGGNKTDGNFDINCPSESIIGKLFINSANQIDAMGFTCDNLHTYEIVSSESVENGKARPHGGHSAGYAASYDSITGGNALVGWKIKTGTYKTDKDENVTVISSFQALYAHINQDGTLGEVWAGTRYGDQSGDMTPQQCEGNKVIAKIESNQGSRVDALKATCRPLKLFGQPQ